MDEIDDARERRAGRRAYAAFLVDLALLIVTDVVLAHALSARSFDVTDWLLLGGAYLVLSVGFYLAGASAMSREAAIRVDRRYGLTIDDSVSLIGDPTRRHPLVTRICALPVLLVGPALVVGVAVSDLPTPGHDESWQPLPFAVVAVALVAAISPPLWAYYGYPGWGLAAVGVWFAFAGLLVAGLPVAALAVGFPAAVGEYIVNRRMGLRLREVSGLP